MSVIKRTLAALLRDESGAEAREYALVLGLVMVVAISLIGAMGGRMLARWTRSGGDM